jgi:hypothetical protein
MTGTTCIGVGFALASSARLDWDLHRHRSGDGAGLIGSISMQEALGAFEIQYIAYCANPIAAPLTPF